MKALSPLADDDPITLAEASDLLRGAVTVATLRSEIRRGNLMVERIGKNLFTTPRYIREMRAKCRVQQNRPASTSAGTKAETASGSSGTGTATDEQVALKGIAKALKNGSLTTSRRNTPPGPQKAASPIPFPSRKS